MISLNTTPHFIDDDHHQAVIRVTTKRCLYSVSILDDQVRVRGPGIEELYELGDDIPEELTYEGIAAIAVLLTEERE